MVRIAVVLNAHENSPVFLDTMESIRHFWTDEVLVVVDAKGWSQFSGDAGFPKLEGFYHGRESAPFRNVCLGMMKAWETWGSKVDWYCYMEYDCLVGSSIVKAHLSEADRKGVWLIGNDYRVDSRKIPFLDRFSGSPLNLHYLLGCCLFFSREFVSCLSRHNFFESFLGFTNFHVEPPHFICANGRKEMVYDLSEFMYPSLAIRHGGKVAELDCWEGSRWRSGGGDYPLRFRPDLCEGIYEGACVMHPLKALDCPVRTFHRNRRRLTKPA